jgi:hypothetical protein
MLHDLRLLYEVHVRYLVSGLMFRICLWLPATILQDIYFKILTDVVLYIAKARKSADVITYCGHLGYDDRHFGLVVRVPGCRPGGPWFDSRRYQIFCVVEGLERSPLSPCEDK